MATKITYQGNWQLSIGRLSRVEAFPSAAGTQQLILTMAMDKKAVTQFATMTCEEVEDSAWKIARLCDQNLPVADYSNDIAASLNTLKKCLNRKVNVLLQKDKKHWKTVGVGKIGALDSFWFFTEGEPEAMLAHVREEHLKMLPNLPKARRTPTKI